MSLNTKKQNHFLIYLPFVWDYEFWLDIAVCLTAMFFVENSM